ncbi:MAG TPA: MotA/TolQ/ExbB proton channel family protein [Pirellulales bacterium]
MAQSDDKQTAAAKSGAAAKAPPLLEIFDEALIGGAAWDAKAPDKIVRENGAFSGKHWFYLHTREGRVSITGLSIPVRENPAPGEYRFLSFAWRKWGEGQIALQIDRASGDDKRGAGDKYGYRYDAGPGKPVSGSALRLADKAPEEWADETRDLWQDFGDCTITGLTFISVEGRDAGFDHIYLAKSLRDFKGAIPPHRDLEAADDRFAGSGTNAGADSSEPTPRTLPMASMAVQQETGTTASVAPAQQSAPAVQSTVADTSKSNEATPDKTERSENSTAAYTTSWGEQLRHAGITGLVQLALSIFGAGFVFERLFHLRQKYIAPVGLADRARKMWADGKFAELEKLKETQPSTMARVISFIAANRKSSLNEVSEICGELVSRELAIHYQKAYPLGIVATLAPLLGLLGMILGMIQTFQIVATAGTLGDPTQLASGISEALVTTGLGLAIAIPFLALYHFFKYRTLGFGVQLEEQLTSLLTAWLMKTDSKEPSSVCA